MTDKLKLGKGFSITIDQMLQRWAILGMSGAGKSNTAVVMVEEMYRLGIPFVVIDPKGDWWGVRSSKTGKSGGLDIPIFGGEHGDIPLYADGGAVMADAVAAQEAFTQSILDVSQFEDHELLRFLMDFADRIYKVNRKLIMLVLEEADEYIPQNKESPEQAKSVGKWSRIVKRGRTRGLLTVLVALRNSELAKSVLNFSDSVWVHRATAKLDRDAVKGWVEYSGDSKEILDSMPTLDDGEAWLSSPQKLKVTKRVQIFRRHTFDSGATPDLDTDRARVTMKEVDLGAIEERMKETIERAKAQDPEELRKRLTAAHGEIETLKLDVERALNGQRAEPVEVEVKVPIFGDDNLVPEDLRKLTVSVTEMAMGVKTFAERMERQVDRAEALVNDSKRLPPGAPTGGPSSPPQGSAPRPSPPAPPRRDTPDDDRVSGPQRRILDALASLENIGVPEASKTQLALFAKASPKSSAYANNLGGLRSAGLVHYPQPSYVGLTGNGRALADASQAPTTTAELHNYVRGLVGGPKSAILDQLIRVYPDALAKERLAEHAGASATSSAFSNNLGSLRSLGLIDYPRKGEVVALPVLFLEGR